MNVGIIGLGRMGRCLVQGLVESKALKKEEIFFTTRSEETARPLIRELGVKWIDSNVELVKKCELIVLAVKPQNVKDILAELKGAALGRDKTIVSIVASLDTDRIEKELQSPIAVLRAMPNTPAFVREGVTAVCLGKYAKDSHWQYAKKLFEPLGKLVRVEERHMNAVTGLSGCGPAYVYVILESLADAGIKVGLPRDLATLLASQTVLGAAKMLQETGRHPAHLKDEVTTPAGCTIDGLMELEEGKLRVTLIKAVVQATKRAEKLAKFFKI